MAIEDYFPFYLGGIRGPLVLGREIIPRSNESCIIIGTADHVEVREKISKEDIPQRVAEIYKTLRGRDYTVWQLDSYEKPPKNIEDEFPLLPKGKKESVILSGEITLRTEKEIQGGIIATSIVGRKGIRKEFFSQREFTEEYGKIFRALEKGGYDVRRMNPERVL